MSIIALLLVILGIRLIFKKGTITKYINKTINFSEKQTIFLLNKLNKKEYFIYNNILMGNDGYTTEIDHIVVSRYGVFVIETKDYVGKIFGTTDTRIENWYQYLGKNKYPFYNPIKQNAGHINCLIHALDIERNNFISIVNFSDKSRLQIKYVSTEKRVVLHTHELLSYIRKTDEILLTEDEVGRINTKLKELSENKNITLDKHIENMRVKGYAYNIKN